MSYPNTPWYKKAGTSEAAAKAITPAATPIRDQVLAMIQTSLIGLTTDECAQKLKLSVLTVRPRFSELAKANLIEDTGERRKNASKKMATVWKASVPVQQSA